MLKIQYRMNQDIMKWSSEAMYNNELIADESVANHLLSDSPNYALPADLKLAEECRLLLNNACYMVDTSY